MEGATVFESKNGVRQGTPIRGQRGVWCKSYFRTGKGFNRGIYVRFEFAKKYDMFSLLLGARMKGFFVL